MKPDVWSVNLEKGDHCWYAHIVELPGCFARGESRGEVLNSLPAAIKKYSEFLEAHGLQQEISSLEFDVVEEIHGISELGEAGGAVALFTSDKIPVTEKELDFFLNLMQWNRQDLLTLVQALPENIQNARPMPKKWTIKETLNHIANAEEWYISRLGATIQKEYEMLIETPSSSQHKEIIFEHLKTIRNGAIQILRKAFSKKVGGSFTRAAYTTHPKEVWTFRKVLRRFIEHEREHIGTIEIVIFTLR
ncbi:MAG: DinB family protein [Promethearchaeota archaeon]